MSFTGKKIIVTGGAGGIGLGIVTELIKNGGKVVAVDISKEGLEKLQNDLGTSVEILHADLTNWNEVHTVLEPVLPVDMLVNCAGVAYVEPIGQVSEKSFQKQFDLNVKGLFAITKVVVEDMLKRNIEGSIVNISSQASQAGLLYHTAYCATKGAVDAFTRALALEVGPNKIRVNSVNPTVVLTELGKRAWSDKTARENMLAKIPLKRFAEIEDVVNVVLFLLSDKSTMVHGQCLPVDGGFIAC